MGTPALTSDTVKYLVVHCSATQAKKDIGAKEIDRMHRQRGFLKIGYHFVVRRSGVIEEGRKLTEVGAHVEGFNSQSIGICLVGGATPDLKPEANFTDDQYAALAELLTKLRLQFPKADVLGHRDFKGVKKDCPCFSVKDWLKETVDVVSDHGSN